MTSQITQLCLALLLLVLAALGQRTQDPYQNQQYGNNPSQQFGNNPNQQFGNNPTQQFGNNPNQQFGSNPNPNQQFGNNPNEQPGRQFGDNRQFGNNNQQFGSNNNNNNNENCCEEYCYVSDEEPYANFATKTSYDSVPRRSGNQHEIPECTPVQFWSINRHGTRYPSPATLERIRGLTKLHQEITKNYEDRRSYPDKGRLCPQDYDLLRRWRWNDTITPQKNYELTTQGTEEIKLLARRYKARYSQLLGQYNEGAFAFQYTNEQRTHDTYQAFIEGLFGPDAFRVHANTFNDEKLTKPYENCKAWTDNMQDNFQRNNEYMRFKEKQEYVQLVRDVFTRLGFRYSLNASIIHDIYDLCRFEKAWNVQQRSPWCIAFTKSQLKLLEYAEDLKYYYETGYGNKMSEKLGCASVKDFYEKFEKTVNGDNTDGNKASFFFTHSPTIQSVIAAMGIAKDYTPLTADNYYQQARRSWKTSVIDPFASNLAAILYQCRGNDKYKVMFFLNEIPVEFPECSVGLCNWSTVQQKFQDVAESCNVEGFCNGESGASTTLMSYLVSLFVVPLMIYVRI